MKLVQLNIWQGRILKHVVRFLQEQKPDIICLQEIYSCKEHVPNWDSYSSLEILQEALPEMKHWFFAPLFSYKVWGRRVTQGNAIASRFPMSNEHVEFTHGRFVKDEDHIPNTRNFQTCQLTIDDKRKLSLVNHHAYWDKNPAGNPTSVKAMRKVVDAVNAIQKPIIVCGDLNVRPETETMQLFKGLLENLTETHGVKTTLTQVAGSFDNNNTVACDHILVSSDVQVKHFEVSDEIVSDHKPLVLEFDLK